MALTRVAAAGINTGGTFVLENVNTSGIVTAGTVQVGAATTIHSGGIDLGSGNITSHNINSTGIITATGGFVGAVTGNVTGNLTGDVTGNVTGNLTGDVTGDLTGNVTGNVTGNLTGTATTASSLSGTPNVIVGVLTATDAVINGNLTVQGTTTTLDTTLTEVDKLEVGANNATVGVAITQSGAGDILRLYDSSTQVVTVADGGNVGIGSDIPATKLNVIGDARIEGFSNAKIQIKRTGNTVANGSIEFIGSDNSFGWGLIANYDAGGSNFNIKEGSNSRLYIKSGNVGINSTSPTAKLDVVGNTQVTGDSQVTGNARVTGILTVGQNSTSINGAHEYPSIRPTLDLNFAATKTLDRRITFTRDSLGTYVDELGIVRTVPNNTPRFDHNPDTGESLGLLIEESRTNLITRSEDWTVGWIDYDVADTANSTTAPDGTTTATKIVASNTNAEHMTQFPSLTSSANTYYTYSVFCKSAELSSAAINVSASRLYATFNLANGTVITSNSNGTDFDNHSATITSYPNGWFRLTLTGQSLRNTSSEYVRVALSNSSTNTIHSGGSWQGDGTSGLYVWGAQYEQGSFATSYIPTSGSTVTRAVEIASITGTNFTGFYNGTEGTVFSEIRPINLGEPTGNGHVYWSFNQVGGFGEGFYFSNASGAQSTNGYLVQDNSATQVTGVNASNLSDGVDFKSALVYKENDYISATNGTLGNADTGATVPTNERLVIGNNAWGTGGSPSGQSNAANAHFKSFKYYNKRLPNAQLQGLTAQ